MNCKICHTTDDIGNQYRIWKSSLHAKAYETPLTEESKKIDYRLLEGYQWEAEEGEEDEELR